MTIDTEQQKPWYHGVRWALDIKSSTISVFVVNEAGKHITSLPVGADWWHDSDNKSRWLAGRDGREASLIAAAPETATERDNLKAENERIREVFKYADTQDWDFLMGLLEKAERHDQDAETQLWVSIMQDMRGIIQGTSPCK